MNKQYAKKRTKVTAKQKSRTSIYGLTAVVIMLVLLTFVYRAQGGDSSVEGVFGNPVTTPRSYEGMLVTMTRVEPEVSDGWIGVSLEEVISADIVYFEYPNDAGDLVPLMAYITPSGRIFAGSSMCEPCNGRTYSLVGETLVCDVCGTTFNVETHESISGSRACGSYPPVYMDPVVDGDQIRIKEEDVKIWRSRL